MFIRSFRTLTVSAAALGLTLVGTIGPSVASVAHAATTPLTVYKAGAPRSLTSEVEPGTGFRMESTATLQRSGALAGQLDVSTHTWSTNVLFGFTGGVYILLKNQDGAIIGVTQLHTYGVNAKTLFMFASSNRYDNWTERFDPRVAEATATLEIVQQHTPKDRIPGLINYLASLYEQAQATCQRLKLCGS
jgi:hypothetical protein